MDPLIIAERLKKHRISHPEIAEDLQIAADLLTQGDQRLKDILEALAEAAEAISGIRCI